MVSKAVKKTAMDSTSVTLIMLGISGLTTGINGANIEVGILGGIALAGGIALFLIRHIWNEKTKVTDPPEEEVVV